MTGTEFIEHGELLTAIFGAWPDFHDAVILGLNIRVEPEQIPEVEAEFHLFEITQNISDMGYLELRHHTRATMIFSGVEDLAIHGIAQRNEIASFDVSKTDDGQLAVHFGSKVGGVLNVEFRCARATVTDAIPFAVSSPTESAQQVLDRVRQQRAQRRS